MMLIGRFSALLQLAWLASLVHSARSLQPLTSNSPFYPPSQPLFQRRMACLYQTPSDKNLSETDTIPPPPSPPLATNHDADIATTENLNKKLAGRKKRVKAGYRLVTVGNLLFASLFLRNDGLTPFSAYAVSGPLLAAGVSNILYTTAAHDRLSSDTYKRSSLAMALYGLLACVAAIWTPRDRLLVWTCWSVTSLAALINSIKAYGYGLKGWNLDPSSISPRTDLVSGIQATVGSMVSLPQNLQSCGYQAITLFVMTLQSYKLVDLVQTMMDPTTATPYFMASRLLRLTKLGLLTTVTFTLKDAADRGRLTGSTFIQLQFMAALVFGSMAAYYKSISVMPLYTIAAMCSVFSAVTGMVSQAYKSRKVSSSNST